jgi:hypothetical protein
VVDCLPSMQGPEFESQQNKHSFKIGLGFNKNLNTNKTLQTIHTKVRGGTVLMGASLVIKHSQWLNNCSITAWRNLKSTIIKANLSQPISLLKKPTFVSVSGNHTFVQGPCRGLPSIRRVMSQNTQVACFPLV